jgi:hypothetical protein
VNALSDLLESFQSNTERQPIKCNLFLDLVLGMNAPADLRFNVTSAPASPSASPADENFSSPAPSTPARQSQTPTSARQPVELKSYNLLETLRTRVNDDKPLVRVRAVTAFGLALRLKYPKYTQTLRFDPFDTTAEAVAENAGTADNLQLEHVSMFICEDDVNMLIERCDDVSVSVRKCAISALADLLKAKPDDISIVDAWVTAVLPLVADAESTVQSKVAVSLMDLVLSKLIFWYKQQKRKQSTSSSDEDSTMFWHQLLIRIAEVDHVKLLRECIQVLLKQQTITMAGSSSDSKLSLIELLEAAKKASCCGVDGALTQSAVEPETVEGDSIASLRSLDPALMSKAGWILLEALVGHETSIQKQYHLHANSEAADSGDQKAAVRKAIGQGLKSADFVVRCFMNRRSSSAHTNNGSTSVEVLDEEEVRMLTVLQMLAPQLPAADAQTLKLTLVPLLANMKQTPAAVSVGIQTMFALSMAPYVQANTREVYAACCNDVRNWCGQLMSVCYPVLMSYCWGANNEVIVSTQLSQQTQFYHSQSQPLTQTPSTQTSFVHGAGPQYALDGLPAMMLHRHVANGVNNPDSSIAVEVSKSAIFLLGEISMLGFSIEEEEAHKFQVQSSSNALPVFATTESGGFRIVLPEQLETLIKSLMAVNLPRQQQQQATSIVADDTTVAATTGDYPAEVSHCVCSPDVRAVAFVTMGKLCLRNKTMAQAMVNVFLRELTVAGANGVDEVNSSTLAAVVPAHNTSSPALRSNALLVLGDLCVRYTQLIDRNVGSMAVCLQDESLIVRKHAIVLLTQLLLQDYLKWRGLLLFRFLATCVDENVELAEFARIIIKKTIVSKHPDFFCQHFAEAVIVFSGWCDHPHYMAAKYSGSEVIANMIFAVVATIKFDDIHVDAGRQLCCEHGRC